MPSSNAGQNGRSGTIAGLSEYLGALAGYARVRLKLVGVEAGEAALHYLLLLVFAVLALIVLVFGYLFLCFGLVFAIATLIGGPHTWIWLTFALAFLHLGAAVVLALIIKTRITKPVFTATVDELKKDQQWLSTPPTSENRS